MFLSHVQPVSVPPRNISVPSQAAAQPDVEMDCTCRGAPLRASDRGLWGAAVIMVATVGWLLS